MNAILVLLSKEYKKSFFTMLDEYHNKNPQALENQIKNKLRF